MNKNDDEPGTLTSIGWDLIVGRRTLSGVGLGIALDINPDFTVIFYAITAEQESTNSAGSWDAWVGGADQFTNQPMFTLARDLDDGSPMTNARGEQVAEWCEMASMIGSRMLRAVLAGWGDPEAEAALDAAVCNLDTSAGFRAATAQVVGILRHAVAVSLAGPEA